MGGLERGCEVEGDKGSEKMLQLYFDLKINFKTGSFSTVTIQPTGRHSN